MKKNASRKSARIIAYARQALWSLQASVSVPQRVSLYTGRSVEVMLPEGSRFGIQIDPFGLTLSSQPGILASARLAPGVRIQRLRYTYATGAFQVDALGDRTNLFGLVGSITANKIEFRLHEFFGPLLPAPMREPGYTPAKDESLVENLRSLIDVLRKPIETRLSDGRLSHVRPTVAHNLHLYLHLVAPEAVKVPLEDLGLEVFLPKGASIFVSAQATGSLNTPQIQSLKISSTPGSLVVRTPPENNESIAAVDLQQLHILPGGELHFEYELGMDAIASLPPAVLKILGLGNVDFRMAQTKDVLLAVRGALDRALNQEAPTKLRAFLKSISPLLPGIDVIRIFGLDDLNYQKKERPSHESK